MKYDIIIIGAGVVGCFIARELSKYELNVLVLEKNNDVGNETSSANSAIIHSGYDPLPNTLKAKLNVLGNAMYDQIAKELDVSFKRIGSITLAFNEQEMEILKQLQQRANKNGVQTILLNKDEVLNEEPLLSKKVVGGLLAPTCGIIDPFNLCVHLMENAIDNGVTLKLNEKVDSIIKKNNLFQINQKYEGNIIINCGGIFSDEISEIVNEKSFSITPRKGQYFLLNHFSYPFVKHTLFMLPTNKGKGVLISPTTSNNYLIGPSAEFSNKESKSTDQITLNEVKTQASKMIESIPYFETIRTFAGIRATSSTHDFIIEESKTKNFINVAGIESPGLASSPAIAKMVIQEIIASKISLKEKKDFNPYVKKYIKIKECSFEQKNLHYQENCAYGSIVCKCEQVSKGEILDCLNRSCPPHSIKGLKRRLRVGFGKCQGGMCQDEALTIMANFYHVDKKDIPYDQNEAYILLKKTKGEE